jgi:hypothetical protein
MHPTDAYLRWQLLPRHRIAVPEIADTVLALRAVRTLAFRDVSPTPRWPRTAHCVRTCGAGWVAKADLVPTEANLREAYGSFAELETACVAFCEQVNTRPHRVTRRPPAELLGEERARLHRLPDQPYTAAFGVTRRVDLATPMISFEGGKYSVPHQLAGATGWPRRHGEQIVVVHCGADGPVEVARHHASTAGTHRWPTSTSRRPSEAATQSAFQYRSPARTSAAAPSRPPAAPRADGTTRAALAYGNRAHPA